MEFFSAKEIASFQQLETPFYYYDLSVLEATLKALNKAVKGKPYHVHYAIKANANDKVLEVIKNHGLGIDTVSGNEILKAKELGFDSSQIAFAGVGKTDQEIVQKNSRTVPGKLQNDSDKFP